MSDNAGDPEFPRKNNQDLGTPRINSWIIAALILGSLILVGVMGYAVLTASGIFATSQAIQPPAFITISKPSPGDRIDLTWAVNVQGEVEGILGNELVIQALDAGGEILAETSIYIDAPGDDVGGSERWSLDLKIDAIPGSQGKIVAYSLSPLDGSRVAEDSIPVGYGESPARGELVNIEDHFWRLASLNERPPEKDSFITLQFDDFLASGFGGCNTYSTSFERRGEALRFGFVTSTAKECELPADVMAQEGAYFDALEETNTTLLEDRQMELKDEQGNSRLIFDAVVTGLILAQVDNGLPERAVITITLRDISMLDQESGLIEEVVLNDETQFPIPFVLAYNPKEIIADHDYAIEVLVEDSAGNLLYKSMDTFRVLTGGNPSQIEIIVVSNQ